MTQISNPEEVRAFLEDNKDLLVDTLKEATMDGVKLGIEEGILKGIEFERKAVLACMEVNAIHEVSLEDVALFIKDGRHWGESA